MSEGDKKQSTHAGNEKTSVAESLPEGQPGSRRSKSVLIVAYHFPPAAGQGLPGTQRAVKLTRYLPQFGWTPIVLTVKEASYPYYIERDPQSLEVLPKSLIVSRTGITSILESVLKLKTIASRKLKSAVSSSAAAGHRRKVSPRIRSSDGEARGRLQAIKDFITDMFQIPDEVAGWIIPATFRGRSLIKRNGIDAIIATGRPWSSLVIGSLLSQLTGVPLVADFRDPWMTNPFRARHSRFKNFMDARLERFVVQKSELVIANTDRLRQEFVDRYPVMTSEQFVCIPNGFDPQEIKQSLAGHAVSHSDDVFTLVHAGFLYGKRDPAVLIDAVRMLIDAEKMSPGSLRVILVGPRELPYSLREYIAAKGLTESIEIVDAVPFLESLRLVADSSVALLLQPDTMTQVPSKLFENIGMGKMTIAIADRGSATEKLFAEYDLGFFADAGCTQTVAEAIHAAYNSVEIK